MFEYGERSAQIRLSSGLHAGKVVGKGYADDRATAEYFACMDAVLGGFDEAACGHAQYLSERDEERVRAYVKVRRAERTMPQNDEVRA